MKKLALLGPVLALTLACGGKTEAPPAKADAGALPPPVSSRQGEGTLPPGHPPIDNAQGGAGQLTPPPPGSGEGATALVWDLPKSWTEEPPANPMRKAQYKIPGAGGDAECVVFYFGPGQGGAPQANAERWASQFTLPDGRPGNEGMKTSNMKVGDVEVLQVEVAGTYNGGMTMGMEPAEPKAGYMLLGAVAEGADANWFFKLTGPEATVSAQREAFEGMLRSIRRGGA